MHKRNALVYLRYIIAAAIVVLMFLIGIKRDWIFVSLNKILKSIVESQTIVKSFPEEILLSLFYNILFFVKWYLTIFFSLVYLFFGSLSIYIIYRNKNYIYWMILFFGAVFMFSFIFILVGYLSGHYSICYVFARRLMGLAQSPALLMILIPGFKLLKD